MKKIDEKHYIEGEQIFKNNGQPIPDDEPTILFRGRDKFAVSLLWHYRNLCVADKCTDYQIASIDKMIERFKEFADNNPTMKQPGITRGL